MSINTQRFVTAFLITLVLHLPYLYFFSWLSKPTPAPKNMEHSTSIRHINFSQNSTVLAQTNTISPQPEPVSAPIEKQHEPPKAESKQKVIPKSPPKKVKTPEPVVETKQVKPLKQILVAENSAPKPTTEQIKSAVTETKLEPNTEIKTESANQPEPDAAQQNTIPSYAMPFNPESNYYAELLALIEDKKFYPKASVKKAQQGEVIIEIKLLKDGRLKDIKVIQSSGHFVLDRAAYQTVKKLKRFKPFPKSITLEHAIVQIPLAYRLI